MDAAPALVPRLWYGMPGYAKSAKSAVLCFFRVDGPEYVTLGLTEKAHLAPDPNVDDLLLPSAWFLTGLDAPTEERIRAIIRQAAS